MSGNAVAAETVGGRVVEDERPKPKRAEWLPHEVRGRARPLHGAMRESTYDSIDAWRVGISDAFVPLVPEAIGHGAFRGTLQDVRRGPITLSRIEGSSQVVRRGAREIATTRGDLAYFNIQLSGSGEVRSGGGIRKTEPGSGAIVLAEHQFELKFEQPFRQLCVAMPINWIRARCELSLGVAVTRNVDLLSGTGRVVKAALSALMEAADPCEIAQCGDLFATALDMALRPHRTPSVPDKAFMPSLVRLLTQRIGDDSLSPTSAAAALGCSVRTLHAACQREGRSFGRMLLDVRLNAAEEALRSTPALSRRVGPIAFACGFSDLSHFSRVFRARFGVAPRDYRGPLIPDYDAR